MTGTPLRVGFVGLGAIGKPMALRLAAAEAIDLGVYDVVRAPVEELEAAGARGAGSVAELASRSDVVCVMVRDDEQVRDVAREVGDRAVLVVHSTVAPSTPAELAERGHVVLDAPVSGGPMGAAEGTLAIMAGGPEEVFATARPALEAMGSMVVHAGPVGAGTCFKLARNLMHFVSFTAAMEASRLAEAAGLDVAELGRVVRHTDAITGGPGAIMLRNTTSPIPTDDFWHPILDHVRTLGEKDLSFAIALADQLGVDVPLAREALPRLGQELGL
jgi:3-hydroxyisobutyrate dehydrogenase